MADKGLAGNAPAGRALDEQAGIRWPPMLLVLAGPAIYFAGLWLVAHADGADVLHANCFDSRQMDHLTPGRAAYAVIEAIGGVLFLCVAPCVLGMHAVAARLPRKRETAAAWSLAGNTLALIAICCVLRNTVGIHRESFCAAWLAWTVAMAYAAKQSSRHAPRAVRQKLQVSESNLRQNRRADGTRSVPATLSLFIGLAAITACLVLFRREVFVQCFNGDGTELDELARSLHAHFLPYWEIEPTGQFGTAVVNPLVSSSYWTFGFQVLLGQGELPTRLPYFVWWLGIFLVAAHMVRPPAPQSYPSILRDTIRLVPLALLLFLSAIWYIFYAGYDPYQGDVANPGVSDAMFTLWLLLGLNCLGHCDLAGWIIATVGASLVFYAGPVAFVLTAAAAWYWQPVPRWRLIRAGLISGGILVGILLLYLAWGWWQGTLPAWRDSFDEEWLSKYFSSQPRTRPGLLFLGYFLLGCGFVPALGLIYAFFRGTPWQRTLATVILAYLAIILGCGLKNLHYLGPFLPLTLVLWMTCSRDFVHTNNRLVPALLATLGLIVSIWLCWPPARPVFMLNRELGSQTVFRTNSYEEACHWARVRTPLYDRGDLSWQISQHTWVGYATLSARTDAPRPLCVTDGGPPSPDYALVFTARDNIKLYCRDPQLRAWLAAQHPPAGRERFPRVFWPIAPEPDRPESAPPR